MMIFTKKEAVHLGGERSDCRRAAVEGPSGVRAWKALSLACVSALLPMTGQATDKAVSPLSKGWYVAPLFSHIEPDNGRGVDAGQGATLAMGYRLNESFALEVFGVYGTLKAQSAQQSDATLSGGGVGGLAFFGGRLSGLYLPFGVGYLQSDPQGARADRYRGMSLELGLGYLIPVRFSRYEFALRAEGRVRHHNGQDGRRLDEDPSGLHDALLNVGLQLPLGMPAPELVPAPAPVVAVVPVPDSDGDGVLDDADRCPETPPGQAVDAAGCPVVSAPPPCTSPRAGAAASLAGCTAGSVLTLHGVTFPSNRAVLTSTAEDLLDQVASELHAHPQIRIEIAGHTDSQGADALNDRLSQQRADAVRKYLLSAGVGHERVVARGYGKNQPRAENDSEAGRAQNRRVELRVLDAGALDAASRREPVPVVPAGAERSSSGARADDETLDDLLAF